MNTGKLTGSASRQKSPTATRLGSLLVGIDRPGDKEYGSSGDQQSLTATWQENSWRAGEYGSGYVVGGNRGHGGDWVPSQM